jgi:branched-chain amino acid aminotransferase
MVICQLPRRASTLLSGRADIWRANVVARLYSTSKLQGLDASQLSIAKTTTPRKLLPPEQLVFGHSFTDHMLTCEWTASQGKNTPQSAYDQNSNAYNL